MEFASPVAGGNRLLANDSYRTKEIMCGSEL
jgi:hypothetical protein